MKITIVFLLILAAEQSAGKSEKYEDILCVSPTSYDEISRYNDCSTLEEYLSTYNMTNIRNNSKFIFMEGNHYLNTAIEIRSKENIHLSSEGGSAIIICTGHAGFIFKDTSHVTIKGLMFIGCGADSEDPEDNCNNITASLIFFYGSDLTLINITISKAIDGGIVSVNVRGTTYVSEIRISDTNVTSSNAKGNKISYINCSMSYMKMDYTLVFKNSCIDNNHYQFSKLMSGLMVSVEKCYAVINITNVHFTNNTSAHNGGNLVISLENITDLSKLQFNLINSVIEYGNAYRGGGAYITISRYVSGNGSANMIESLENCRHTDPQRKMIYIKDTVFHSNVGTKLGAGLYIQHKNFIYDVCTHSVTLIENCNFTDNYLLKPKNGGVALHTTNYILVGYMDQVKPQNKLKVKGCRFENNFVLNNDNKPLSGNSVLLMNSNDYFGIEEVLITNNKVSAIIAISSNIIFSKETTLSYNTGSSGGGLLLCRKAIIYLDINTTLNIYNNSVNHAGGGICVEPQCLQTKPMCFFQFVNEIQYFPHLIDTVKINISNNKAHYSGDNIFGGDVDICYMLDNPKNNLPTFNNTIFNDIFHIEQGNSVSSPPRQICFCIDDKLNCSMNETSQEVYPGQDFTVSVVLVGQREGTVPGIVQTWAPADGIFLSNKVQNITRKCSRLNYKIEVQASFNFSKSIYLMVGAQHTGDQSGYERLREFNKRNITVTLKKCPIGFNLSSDSRLHNANRSCEHCNLNLKCSDQIECFIDDDSTLPKIRRKKYASCWINYNETFKLIYFNPVCPFDYCTNKAINLTMTKSSYEICANNRTDKLCGSCKTNFSAMLGSSSCGRCTNHYLLLLLVFALAGLFLVLFLTIFNLTVAEGTLSGLIFYANVIECNAAYIIPHTKDSPPSPTLTVFLAWINLDLGIETCLYDGMDAYVESWLQFVFPIYIWLISIVIILLSNRYRFMAMIAGRNAVKVLATLVLLSYAKFLHAIMSTFSFTEIHILYEDNTVNHTKVWGIDGNIEYYSTKHIVLLAAAVLFGFFSFPFTIVMLFIKPLQQYSHKRLLKFIQTLKPFIDAFTGPYTDSGRFWPGLLLVVRIGLSTIGGRIGLDKKILIGVTVLIMTALLGIAGLVRPGLYRKRALDALELFFLLNLSLLFLGTAYYSYSDVENSQKVVFDILVGLAFLTAIGILLYHAWLTIRRYRYPMYISTWINNKINQLINIHVTLKTNRRMNNYPPTVCFTEEREPLLADHED